MQSDSDARAAVALLAPFSTPVTEPLALIAKGGITTAYFCFAYKGFDPHVAVLTTNTFDPFERMLTALSVEREDVGSRSFEAAEKRLRSWLEEGSPTAVWLDLWSLPWMGYETSYAGMYGSFPIVLCGFESDRYLVAGEGDLSLDAVQLERAWGRLKKDRFRMLRVTEVHAEGLIPGLLSSLRVCTDLFLKGPRAGIPAANFGLPAYDKWAEVLTSPKGPQSWSKVFVPGRSFLNGIATAWAGQYGLTGVAHADAWRPEFARGLRDLGRLDPSRPWAELAPAFEAAGEQWRRFGDVVLPHGPLRSNLEAQLKEYQNRSASGGTLWQLRLHFESLLAAEEASPEFDAAAVEAWKARIAGVLPAVKAADETAFRALAELLG